VRTPWYVTLMVEWIQQVPVCARRLEPDLDTWHVRGRTPITLYTHWVVL
jgi:hypothetical protein